MSEIKSDDLLLLVDEMRDNLHNRKIVIECCKAIEMEAENHPDIRRKVVEFKGIEIIVNAMKKQIKDPDVLQQCCKALMNIALSTEFEAAIIKSEAVEIIIKSMNSHPNHELLHQSACGALGNLAGNEKNSIVLVQKGAAGAIIKSMEHNIKEELCCQHGCWALRNLALQKSNRHRLIELGIADVLVRMMSYHKDNVLIQHHVCNCLMKFKKKAEYLQAFISCGLEGALQNAIKYHGDSSLQAAQTLMQDVYKIQEVIEKGFSKGSLHHVKQAPSIKSPFNDDFDEHEFVPKESSMDLDQIPMKKKRKRLRKSSASDEDYADFNNNSNDNHNNNYDDDHGHEESKANNDEEEFVYEVVPESKSADREDEQKHDEVTAYGKSNNKVGSKPMKIPFLLNGSSNQDQLYQQVSEKCEKKIQKSFARVTDANTLKEFSEKYFTLKALLEYYKSLIDQHKSSKAETLSLKSGIALDSLETKISTCKFKLDSAIDKLGSRMICQTSDVPEWEIFANERDQSRNVICELYEEFLEFKKKFELQGVDVKSDIKIEHRDETKFLNIEQEMQRLCSYLENEQPHIKFDRLNVSPSDSKSIHVVSNDELVDANENQPKSKRRKEEGTQATNHNSSSSSIFLYPEFVLVEKTESGNWLDSFSKSYERNILKAQSNLMKSIDELQIIMRAVGNCAKDYKRAIMETFSSISRASIRSLIEEVKLLINERVMSQSYGNETLIKLDINSYFKDINIEKELELNNRRKALDMILDTIRVHTLQVETSTKNLRRVDHDQEKHFVESNINQSKYERDQCLETVIHLSRSIDSVMNTDSRYPELKYDFPDVPYLALLEAEAKKLPTSLSPDLRDIALFIQRNGFLLERSFNHDYEFNNLPDYVKEIASLREVRSSSSVICISKIFGKSTQSTQLKEKNLNTESIKVLQLIDVESFGPMCAAVLLASRIRHPSILPMETVFLDSDKGSIKVFIQTPFRMGGSMKRWLSLKERSVGHKLDALSKIADGLHAVHIHGIVHRDIKLENVVMDSNDDLANPAICDFDTSREVTSVSNATTIAAGGGKKIGTIKYLAPEIFERGERETRESDIWSFVMMMLITLVYDGKYENVPTKKVVLTIERVVIEQSLSQAKQVIGKQYPTIMKLFEQVLGSNADISQSRPNMSEIRDILLNADTCECYLCKSTCRRTAIFSCKNGHTFCRNHFCKMIDESVIDGVIKCSSCVDFTSDCFNYKDILYGAGISMVNRLFDVKESNIKSERSDLGLRIERIKITIEDLCIAKCPGCGFGQEPSGFESDLNCRYCEVKYCIFCLKQHHNHKEAHDVSCCQVGLIVNQSSSSLSIQGHDEVNPYLVKGIFNQKIKMELVKYWKSLDPIIRKDAVKNSEIRKKLEAFQVLVL